MLILVLGLVLFLGVHAFTMNRGARARLRERLGEGAYKGVYSLLSILGFVILIWGYGLYRSSGYIPVWEPPKGLAHAAMLLNLPIFVLLLASQLPGWIRAKVKHPMLLGIKLWATAHLLSNGDLGSILLFGSFLAWAVASRISIKRRVDAVPVAAVSGWQMNDTIAAVGGLALYLAFVFWLHAYLIGVSPMAG